MALILACLRRIAALDHAIRKGGWLSSDFQRLRQQHWQQMIRLCGKTIGLVGFGAIARCRVAKAREFGLNIIASTRTSTMKPSGNTRLNELKPTHCYARRTLFHCICR